MFRKNRKPLTQAEEIEQYRKYQEWARQQTWVTMEAPDGSLLRMTQEEAKAYWAKLHPPVYKGKTLDELSEPLPKLKARIEADRKKGLSDKEIWESFPQESREDLYLLAEQTAAEK